ncbi:MAG: hypothetical protein KDA31_02270 [Phycisphaerales bacterium]|nr:hypothetical protein [Phycisphaerales bacterium]MCB9835656.1 hypothetical protein [Phycisphaera sp.]
MTHALLGLVLSLGVLWQPLPEEMPADSERLRLAQLGVPTGGRAWAVPGPYETEWLVSFDETPLTVDEPVIDLRLVNVGRPVRVPRTTGEASMVVTLTDAAGNVRKSEQLTERVYLYQSGTDEGRIDTDRPMIRASANLDTLFGELPTGTYEAFIEIDTDARLERARDGHVIVEELKLATPRFRFEVVDVPAIFGEDQFVLSDEEVDQFGNWSATLTNTLDVPIQLWVDGMLRSDLNELGDESLFAYNGLERWTDIGWADVQMIGHCGTGMQKITLEPGQSQRLSLIHHNAPKGIFRAVVNAWIGEDERLDFVSGPVTITGTESPRPISE